VTELHVVNSDSNDLTDFLDYLFSGLEGYTYSPTKESSGKFDQHFFEWPAEKEALVEHVKSNRDDREVYLAPAIFDAPQAIKSHFKATNVLWAEFDGNVPDALGEIPEPTYRVQSSGPGHEHWYWKLDSPLTDSAQVDGANRSITYALSADTSGWDCNQVLRPPLTTNHKRGGVPVAVKATSDSTLSLSGFAAIPAAPEPMVELTDSTIPDVSDVILKYAWPAEAIKTFRMTKDTVPTGDGRGRNVALVYLGYHCAEMGMTDVEIFSVLRNADDRWGKYKDRTDRNKRLTSIIERVRVKYPQVVFQDEEIIPVFGYQDLLDTEITIEWVIEGLLQEQGSMLFTGPSGVGKTQVTLRLAIAMALGKKWLDFPIDKPRKVLFFSFEMGHPDLKYFLTMMNESLNDADRALLQSNFILVPYGEPLYLDSDRGRKQYEAIISDVQPDGVFIDSVGSITSGSLTSEETVKNIVDYNDHIRKKYSVFTWMIHHMRKAQAENKKPNKLADVYGNQYLVNRATSVYCLWPKGTKIEVIPLKKRLAKLEEPWDIQRLINLDFMRVAEFTFQEPTPEKTLEYKQSETPVKTVNQLSADLEGGL
jgi:hypothetical protein